MSTTNDSDKGKEIHLDQQAKAIKQQNSRLIHPYKRNTPVKPRVHESPRLMLELRETFLALFHPFPFGRVGRHFKIMKRLQVKKSIRKLLLLGLSRLTANSQMRGRVLHLIISHNRQRVNGNRISST